MTRITSRVTTNQLFYMELLKFNSSPALQTSLRLYRSEESPLKTETTLRVLAKLTDSSQPGCVEHATVR